MKNKGKQIRNLLLLLVAVLMSTATAFAQKTTVKGTVFDNFGDPITGAAVILKSDRTVGVATDIDGNFTLQIPDAKNAVLVVSFVGMATQEVQVNGGKLLKITLQENAEVIEDVVVVGYGQQKKASVVGAITQATGETLQRAAGINNLGQALTGNLPGVVTMSSSGMPGDEEPQILIRGTSSWNGSDPLVLVDGVERKMSSVDMSSVANISVLKDASATAVYGVRGANGVILITTKRGQEGRAQINVSANAIMKIPSKLPGKLDSYDAMQMRNIAIENELNVAPGAWTYAKPQSYINNYRNQEGKVDEFGNLYSERYPNVDWQDALFEKFCMAYNANLNVAGGNHFVKYFASVDFVQEGDIYKDFGSFRGYETGYDYKRFNVRSNLDFTLTKTTTFRVSIAGSNGIRQTPWSNSVENDWQQSQKWSGIYNIGPDVFVPQYADGAFGFLPHGTNVTNSAEGVATGGTMYQTATTINTDFALEQKLDFITKGLSFRGSISWDNQFNESNRGINDLYTSLQHKWINPETGEVVYKETYDNQDQFDYVVRNEWSTQSGSVNNWGTFRRLYYQLQLNWVRSFNKHNISAMGLFARNEFATGSALPNKTENWAFRATYDWATRYFIEYNGAYNGSQKFSDANRFAFFQSGALGWMISEEKFMKFLKQKRILDMMKLRVSYGEIGDDNGAGSYLYMDQWSYGGKTTLDVTQNASPYAWYRQSSVGNPNVHWEVVRKLNAGVDYSFFDGLVAGTLEFFKDKRSDILINGGSRAVPSYLGITPSTINKGKVNTQGYELELRLNKTLSNRMHFWGNFNMTHAESKIILKDDAPLLPDYRKEAGYAIGQTHSYIDHGVIMNQDELYASPQHDSNDNQKLVGDYYIIDFNGDGVVDVDDQAPYGYQDGIPQNTYSATIGWDWKGWNVSVQMYGVNNVTRNVTMTSLSDPNQANVYDQGTWWAQNHNSYDIVTPRLLSTPTYYNGTQFLCDGSFIRLKNAEIGYTFSNELTRRFGVSNLKLFVSGNNLWVWSRMPDDRESNFSSQGGATGAYPTMRRINFGLKFSL